MRRTKKIESTQKTRAENLKLKEALTRSTVELEQKNRELQIEASLEKVRAVALVMKQHSDMLNISKTISHELKRLGLKEIRNVQTAVIYQQKGTYINYEFYAKHKKLLTTEVSYTNHPMSKTFVKQMLTGTNGFFKRSLKGKRVRDWYKFQKKSTNQFADSYLLKASSLNYYWYSLGQVALGISTYTPLSRDEQDLFKRFRNVFELSYRRYLDIEKAEAQAREAQIEAALERVRSRTMAMHQTSELQEVIHTVHNELLNLKLSIDGGSFVVINDDVGPELRCWGSGGTANTSEEIYVPHFNMRFCTDLIKGIQSGPKFFTEEFSQTEKKKFFTSLFEHKPWSDLTIEQKQQTLSSSGGYTRSVAVSKHTTIFIVNHHGRKFTEAENDILKRFSKVFEQTYTRFLDLQKAEAQAREAQIEAALERVRSRSLAMHKSDELKEVVSVAFEKLRELNVTMDSACIITFTEGSNDYTAWAANPDLFTVTAAHIPFAGDSIARTLIEARDKKESFIERTWSFKEKNAHWEFLFEYSDWRQMPAELKKAILGFEGWGFTGPVTKNSATLLVSYTERTYSEKEKEIIRRLGKVFDQAYIRFLDLQKAEAQAREAQIEAALERVRSKALAMHKTEDFNPAVAVVFEELEKLNLGVLRCGISVLNAETRTGDVWVTSIADHGSAVQVSGDESFDIHPLLHGAFEAWLRQEDFYYVLQGDDLTNYYKAVKAARFELPESQFISSESGHKTQHCNVAVYHGGGLFAFREAEFSDEAKNVMKRFANVFDLTYKRFLDLQKAEANAREAQIEAALERVRSRTMAMQKSEELAETSEVLFQQFKQLSGRRVSQVTIGILNEREEAFEMWLTSIYNIKYPTFKATIHEPIVMNKVYWAWKQQKKSITIDLSGDELKAYSKFRKSFKGINTSDDVSAARRVMHTAFFSKGFITLAGSEPQPAEMIQLLERFVAVFDLTYRRFVDLKTAEAQAREAKIEVAMEKVRARAMAMQKADELIEVAQLLRSEMGLLGVEELETSSIYIHNESTGTTECWYAIQDVRGTDKKLVTDHMTIQLNDTWVGREMLKFYKSDDRQTSIVMRGENRKEWINYCSQYSQVLQGYYGDQIPERTYHLVKFSNGYMGAASPGDISAESWDLLKRATNVFSLAYTRFSDLQLAEAQAREATIEVALERVRAKAMAMHNTNDLSSASSTALTELRKLGINPIRFGVGLLSKDTRKALLYSATSSAEGDSLALVGWVMLYGHPVLEDIYESWLKNEDIFPVLRGEQLKSYYEQLLSGLSLPTIPSWQKGETQYGHFFPFSVGCLYAWSEAPYDDAQVKILKRFASIIDLTFRRYMDLQKSEASAKEAVKQAALDRIRADIASMRAITDLDRITPLIWNELTILGVPFIRCGVFIMDDEQKLIHTFLSTPDGKAIGAFHLPYTTGGNIPQVLSNWQKGNIYSDHWDETAFTDFADELLKQGALVSREQYLSTLPAGGFYLHFLPFLQGMLYVGSLQKLNDDQMRLTQSVADAFSTAYARYEDFNKLESAKQQVERTLVDLKQTQQQLIQSEKMASLGELTAGIAHEIQNPLNFVNNFSEVNNELIEEVKSQKSKLKSGELDELLDDIFQNNERINHHGKRADAIVKGMLQHSRTSSGQKELTDINALADEYLRLAYHGLRAKDKSFNAKFETDLDDSIGKLNVVPQELGRVILNLINNAFYAVTEKKRQLNGTYEPTVLVSTKKVNDKIEIKVKDNGIGIPQKVMDKIFQPFFTTKPTGQGTGLGLSLSYDIVTKGHGGELKVETREGEGSEFRITLPY